MRKREKKSALRDTKVRQSGYKKIGGKTLGDLRQLRYKRAFRIPSPFWFPELLIGIEKETDKNITGKDGLRTKVEEKASPETKVLLSLIAEFATGLWRIKRKTDGMDELKGPMQPVRRHIESTIDTLTSAKVEIQNHTGEKYITGMALKVIAFQPASSVQVERIAETIKPSIFYKDKLIQRGEVIVETPEEQQSGQESPTEVAGEIASSSSSQKRVENGGKEHNRTDNT